MTSIAERIETEQLDSREVFAQILLRAADEIDQRGWTAGVMCDDDGAVCALGGIYAALGEEPAGKLEIDYANTAYASVVKALAIELGLNTTTLFSSVFFWNDDFVCKDGAVRVPAKLREIAASLGVSA